MAASDGARFGAAIGHDELEARRRAGEVDTETARFLLPLTNPIALVLIDRQLGIDSLRERARG
jgi:hypothetical protein